ncbi:N-acetylglutaminylglutamine amidotransferase [Beggiatoa leptomitoformis]|uniref:asparagine synthase (glutamine-hydrolyzing) n=1 Tax=Beggiatoa leptomitoformis TaxID=288004 RepID=A0A2N9YFC5_9GAMM|nr:N-acetylglutaminylglutamine amidotransferase [Beggiatoa leptomitoformis]ALG68482.1 N-acetylglutaminylglutamine amidotransferase [Beggiatoa leptomitoformis]AUI69182.1 N-acetylglutaminylglutamine amidotransferase [Beggiatoa leptomitoformis]
MCGICGELRFDNTHPQLDKIKRMSAVLARRGPDSEGYYQSGALAFGHRRLSVIDLSERGTQPMVDTALNLVLVFNGTIYNYRELRHELIEKGYAFQSETDTEVILKAYAEWGDACVDYLQGMFAFAIWDKTQQRLFVARDRVGIKPLYYVKTAAFFRFASSMPALLAAGDVNTQIDPVGLHHHLTLHAVIPAPYTILQGVRKVEPATTLSLTPRGDMQRRNYWQLNATRLDEAKTDQEWLELTHTALKNAVNSHRSVADVPVGVLLSGGLDSSLLVGLLAEHYDAHNLLTFSVGFEDAPEEKGSEFEYSDQVVARYKTRHHRYTIPNSHVLQRLPEAIKNMAEPMVGQDAIAFYLLAEQVSQSVKVVQSGQGADEVFGGYFWYPLMNAAAGSDLDRFRPFYFDRSHAEFLETVHSDYHGADYTAQSISQLLAQENASEFLDKVLRMDVTTLIVDDPVKRVDNMTMAWGLEARVPFLDQQLIETVARMPPALKLRENGKYPLKTIARQLLPASVIDRPKGYFPVPALKYVRGEFLAFMRAVLYSDTCRQRQLFNFTYVDKLLASPETYLTPLQGSKLWHLALLEFWLQTHI